MAQCAKTGTQPRKQTLDSDLVWQFPLIPDEFGGATGGVGNLSSLAFYPYPERSNRTPYASGHGFEDVKVLESE